MPAAILTAITVAREQERVGDLTAELARHVHEADEPDDTGACDLTAFGPEDLAVIDLEDLSFSINDQSKCTANRQNRERLERRVQCQTSHGRNAFLLGRWGARP